MRLVLTDKGRRWRDAVVGTVLLVPCSLVVVSAFLIGQGWKQDRLEQCTHGKAGWTCPGEETP